MADQQYQTPQEAKEEGERVDALYDILEGGYIYGGDGDWSHIQDVRKHDNELVFHTRDVTYESVPKEMREEAYEKHGDGEVIVHPDGLTGELWDEVTGE